MCCWEEPAPRVQGYCMPRGQGCLRAQGDGFCHQESIRFPWKMQGEGCSVWVPLWVTPGLYHSRKIRASWDQPAIVAAGSALRHHLRSGIFHWAAETPFPSSGMRSAVSQRCSLPSLPVSLNQRCPEALGSAACTSLWGFMEAVPMVWPFPLAKAGGCV